MKSLRKLVSLPTAAAEILSRLAPAVAREFGVRPHFCSMIIMGLRLLAAKYKVDVSDIQ